MEKCVNSCGNIADGSICLLRIEGNLALATVTTGAIYPADRPTAVRSPP